MNEKEIKTISKFLSLVLRHSPQTIGLQLDAQGWADVSELLAKTAGRHPVLSRDILELVVSTNDKKRFAFNEDGSRIRASQGHSVTVDLGLEQREPPEYLYHGTVPTFLPAIQNSGLQKMSRQHVHLSADKETATIVARRRGVPVILAVRAGQMYRDGHAFYQSANGVWLTGEVPLAYINF